MSSTPVVPAGTSVSRLCTDPVTRHRLRRSGHRRHRNGGFTMLELMVVVAIVATLASVAIPQYRDYIANSQLTEAFSLFSGVQTAIETHVQIDGVSSALEHDGSTDVGFLQEHRTEGEFIDRIDIEQGLADRVNVLMTFADEGLSPTLAGETMEFIREPEDAEEPGWHCEASEAIAQIAGPRCDAA